MPPANTGLRREIQPHQHLIRTLEAGRSVPAGPESVDGHRRALYKTGNGGGRNPAAAVL
jgi:hypothetical protein